MTPFEQVHAVLDTTGQVVGADAELGSVTLENRGRRTVVMVMPGFGAVVAYAVWPDQVPAERLDDVADLVVRANTALHVCALELDRDQGLLSVRAGLPLGPLVSAPEQAFTGLLLAAVDEARIVAARHRRPVAHVVDGGSVLDALALLDES